VISFTENIKHFFIGSIVFLSNLITFQLLFEVNGSSVFTSKYSYELFIKLFFLLITVFLDYNYFKKYLSDYKFKLLKNKILDHKENDNDG